MNSLSRSHLVGVVAGLSVLLVIGSMIHNQVSKPATTTDHPATRTYYPQQVRADPMARCDETVRQVTVGAEDHTFNPPGEVICYARWFRRSAEGCLEVRDNFGKVLKSDCSNREDLAGQSPAKFRANGAAAVVVDYVLCKEDDPSRQYVVSDGCPIPAQRTARR